MTVTRCNECYEITTADNRDDEYPSYCRACVAACDDCDTRLPVDHLVTPMDARSYRNEHGVYVAARSCHACVGYCDSCDEFYRYISDHRYSCRACGSIVCAETATYCDESDDYYCDSYCHEDGCRRCHDDDGGGWVHDWNYRPSMWRPKGNYPHEALLGVELEICGNPSDIVTATHAVDDDASHLYLMRDGSVPRGLEIVGHPATLSWLKSWDGYARLLDELRRHGCHGDDTYDYGDTTEHGLHIHVSRNAFRSNRHRLAWLMMFYAMADDIQVIARRDGSRWARWERNSFDPSLADMARGQTHGDRYVAVNGRPERTYEVRAFKSTVSHRELMACLELMDATVRYAESLTVQRITRGHASWQPFIRWAATVLEPDGSRRYGNLVAMSDDEGLTCPSCRDERNADEGIA